MPEQDFDQHFTYGKLLRFTVPSIIMMIFSSVYGEELSDITDEEADSMIEVIEKLYIVMSRRK